MCNQQSLRSGCAYAQSDQSLCEWLEYSMIIKLLTVHQLESLTLKGGCRGSSESTLVKMSNCWKSHATAHLMTSQSQSPCLIVLTTKIYLLTVTWQLPGKYKQKQYVTKCNFRLSCVFILLEIRMCGTIFGLVN